MPSPFPGMNPYLEQPALWQDFHNSYLVRVRDALVPGVGPGYFVALEDSVYLSAEPGSRAARRFAVADLGVGAGPAPDPAGVAAAVADRVAAPARGRLPAVGVPKRYRWVSVRDAADGEIVTVVELLSPANKSGAGRDKYLRKREKILRSRASLVEIDLLRGGVRMPVDGVPAADYAVLVARGHDRPAADVWPVALRSPLPVVPVPLRPADPEPPLDLQAALHRTFDAAGYARRAYRAPPDPPLSAADAAWAAGLLAPLREGR